MGLVVRCPACMGASGVDVEARGHHVECPRCNAVFTAVPEAELVAPGRSSRNPTLPTRTNRPATPQLPELPQPVKLSPPPEVDHDPHRHPPGRLPASVLMGLALLPFAIPIFWMVVPAMIGQPPALSIAVPLAIAISASTLSLAVIYTIDWSPALRVKGVLMLVGLAYFAAVSLYFLKKEMLDGLKSNLDSGAWKTVTNVPGGYEVKMPRMPSEDDNQPIPDAKLDCYKLLHNDGMMGNFVFTIGSGKIDTEIKDLRPGTDEWFEKITKNVIEKSRGELDPVQGQTQIRVLPDRVNSGRQFAIKLGNDRIRIVRLFLTENRIYYLSVEGTDLSYDDEFAKMFFNSFLVLGKKN
jgi:hypothetical protein